MPTVDIDSDAAHEAAQRELAKPIYPRASLTERLIDWLNELLYRLTLAGSTVPGGWFTLTLLLIVVTVAVVVAVRVARRTMRINRGRDYELFGTGELSAAEHRATAGQCAARGDWSAAIRHRLRAVARHLEEAGELAPVPGRTAGELAHDAGAEFPILAAKFSDAAMVFNDVAYGEMPGTPAGYQVITDLDDRLRTRTATVSAGAPSAAGTVGWTPVR